MDLYLAIYPAIVLWQLQMYWKKKLGLSLALEFGYWCDSLSRSRRRPSNSNTVLPW